MPGASQAKDSAKKVFNIIDEDSTIDIRDKKSVKKVEAG